MKDSGFNTVPLLFPVKYFITKTRMHRNNTDIPSARWEGSSSNWYTQTQTYLTCSIISLLAAVCQKINFQFLLLGFQCINSLAPLYLSDLLKPYISLRSLSPADQLLLVVPKSSKSRFKLRVDQPFTVMAPEL